MVSEPGRGPGRDDDHLSADPQSGPEAFSDEGMRRIVFGGDRRLPRDGRSQPFAEDTAALADDLRASRRRSLLPIVTALVALACFVGIVWYAYSWGTGQVASDELPVVRAEPMPEKVRPAQPGGIEVPHQGIAVLNNVGEPEPRPTVERLLPRPEAPNPPEPLPAPVAEAAPVAPLPAAPLRPGTVPEEPMAAPPEMPAETPGPEVAEAEIAGAEVAKPLPKPSDAGDQIAALLRQEAPETADGGAGQADVPTPAPAPAPAPAETAAGTPSQMAAQMAAKPGDVVLQLSSVKSETAAAQEWRRLQAAHPALLGKLGLTLETAAVEGTTYYRVLTGPFASRDAAGEVCAQLKARSQDCLVKQR